MFLAIAQREGPAVARQYLAVDGPQFQVRRSTVRSPAARPDTRGRPPYTVSDATAGPVGGPASSGRRRRRSGPTPHHRSVGEHHGGHPSRRIMFGVNRFGSQTHPGAGVLGDPAGSGRRVRSARRCRPGRGKGRTRPADLDVGTEPAHQTIVPDVLVEPRTQSQQLQFGHRPRCQTVTAGLVPRERGAVDQSTSDRAWPPRRLPPKQPVRRRRPRGRLCWSAEGACRAVCWTNANTGERGCGS